MASRQSQEGGEGSNNYQAQEIIMQVGIDEKRVREIYQEMSNRVRKDYSEEAFAIAQSRILEFEDKLMPKMESVEGALEAFADPSFQLLLVEAQKTAASTERPADYDLLSELLVHRFQKGEDRIARAGIKRAVEIVDEISDEALLGITVFHAVSTFIPLTSDLEKGLNNLDELFGKLFYSSLPSGTDWLDHLDILNALRLNTLNSLKKIEDYYFEKLSEGINLGIERGSQSHSQAVEILTGAELSLDILVDHPLNSSYIRMRLRDRNEIKHLMGVDTDASEENIMRRVSLTEAQKEALYSVYDLYSKDENIVENNKRKFVEKWDEKPRLRALKSWWNSLDLGIQITSVGRVLAHSNAQRCDERLPSLD